MCHISSSRSLEKIKLSIRINMIGVSRSKDPDIFMCTIRVQHMLLLRGKRLNGIGLTLV